MHLVATTGPAFHGEPASLGTVLAAGAAVMLTAVLFFVLLAAVRWALAR